MSDERRRQAIAGEPWRTRLVGVYDADGTVWGEVSDDAVREAATDQAPVVVAETDAGRHMLVLASADLDACDGSIDRLIDAIASSLDRLGLTG